MGAAQAFAQSEIPNYMAAGVAFATAASTNPELNPLLGFVPLQFLPMKTRFPGPGQSGTSNDDNSDYSIKLRYELNEQVSIYGGLATGYKASQWNLSRDSAPAQAELTALLAAGCRSTEFHDGYAKGQCGGRGGL